MLKEVIDSNLEHVHSLWENISRQLFAYYGDRLNKSIFDIRLAFNEGLVNAIKHGHSEDGRPLEFGFIFEENSLMFHIYDTGNGFEWPRDLTFGLEDEDSRGLFLIDSVMDEVSYKRAEDKNVLILKKHIPNEAYKFYLKEELKSVNERTILVIEQDGLFLQQLSEFLEKDRSNIIKVNSVSDAFKFFHEEKFIDAAIIDFYSIQFDGIGIIKKFSDLSGQKFIPIMSIIDSSNMDVLVKSFKSGSHYQVDDSINPEILKLKLESMFRLKDMATQLQTNYDELVLQLREARTLQMSVLPLPSKEFNSISFATIFRPYNYAGGDMVNYFKYDDSNYGFYLADVSGHGVAAAMFSLWINRTLLSQESVARLKKQNSNDFEIKTPAEICNFLEESLDEQYEEQFLTLFYGILNIKTGELSYCNAGHPPAYLVDKDKTVRTLDSQNPPVGMGLGVEFTTHKIKLEPGTKIFVYSDCILESVSKRTQEQFGEERLEKILVETAEESTEEQLHMVFSRLQSFMGNFEFDDDLTLLNIFYKGD